MANFIIKISLAFIISFATVSVAFDIVTGLIPSNDPACVAAFVATSGAINTCEGN